MLKNTRLFSNSCPDISTSQWLESKIAGMAILEFLQTHPCCSFSHLTLAHALDEKYTSAVIDAALWQLIREGRVSCRKAVNNRVYRLASLIGYQPHGRCVAK